MRKSFRTTSLLIASAGLILATFFGVSPAHAGVDDFVYEAWHVAAEVSTDSNGRAVARITETISPRFPDTDQNRGMVRGIPTDYQGVGTDPREFSVTDANGAAVPFDIEDEGGFRVVLVGDNNYVHGLQQYVISYTLSDVVLLRDDGKADEFYWDLLDFEHQQPVANFSADIVFSPELRPTLDGNMRCYFGEAKSDAECQIAGAGSAENPIAVSGLSLAAQEGVTVAVGMAPGSVVQPPQRLPNFALDGLPMIIGGLGLAAGVTGSVFVSRFRSARRTSRGTIVAQYDVPGHLPPLIAAPIVGEPTRTPAAAQIIHLAVRGVTRLEEETSATKRKKKPAQLVRVMDPSRAEDPLDLLTLEALAPGAEPGSAVKLPKKSTKFAEKMASLVAAGSEAATERGYLERAVAPRARGLGFAALAISVLLLGLGVAGLALRGSPLPLLFIVAGVVTGILAVYALMKHRVHTPLGAETREYLEGVRTFIQVAEADRLVMLQSYSGAERREEGDLAVIHLYEQLLPYAMLFNLEKEWGKVLEARYSAEPGYVPYWYPGVAAHGFAGLSDTLTRYTDSISSSVTYTSSSSGGSSGGGFAGGGGGGGFSGGR